VVTSPRRCLWCTVSYEFRIIRIACESFISSFIYKSIIIITNSNSLPSKTTHKHLVENAGNDPATRQHFHSQQHGELHPQKKCNHIAIILLTIMIEFTSQNVVTVLCPLVHRFTTVKGLQIFIRISFDLALIATVRVCLR